MRIHDIKNTVDSWNCCGKVCETRYCPFCGKEHPEPHSLKSLAAYLSHEIELFRRNIKRELAASEEWVRRAEEKTIDMECRSARLRHSSTHLKKVANLEAKVRIFEAWLELVSKIST